MKHLTKVILIVACLFALATATMEAQNLVTVVHGGTSTFYTTVDLAYTASADGDYIYIPGGSWTIIKL